MRNSVPAFYATHESPTGGSRWTWQPPQLELLRPMGPVLEAPGQPVRLGDSRPQCHGKAPVGFRAIRLRYILDTTASPEQLETLIRLTERYCVVYQTLAGALALSSNGETA